MTRILFWIALAVLVFFAIRSKLRSMNAPARDEAAPQALEGEAMTSCAHCHVYFPVSEAVRADGLDYCSPAHVRLPAE